MANREACELYIEQEIKSALEDGKKPWTIGKELSAWVEKLFEVTINPQTITKRAQRIEEKEDRTNVLKKSKAVETIEKRDYRTIEKDSINVENKSKVFEFICKICGEKFDVEVWHCENCDHHWQMHLKQCSNCHKQRYSKPSIIENRKTQGGGARKGAGRKPKAAERAATESVKHLFVPVSNAMQLAIVAISQLERIRQDDPERRAALDRVSDWIAKNYGEGK